MSRRRRIRIWLFSASLGLAFLPFASFRLFQWSLEREVLHWFEQPG